MLSAAMDQSHNYLTVCMALILLIVARQRRPMLIVNQVNIPRVITVRTYIMHYTLDYTMIPYKFKPQLSVWFNRVTPESLHTHQPHWFDSESTCSSFPYILVLVALAEHVIRTHVRHALILACIIPQQLT